MAFIQTMKPQSLLLLNTEWTWFHTTVGHPQSQTSPLQQEKKKYILQPGVENRALNLGCIDRCILTTQTSEHNLPIRFDDLRNQTYISLCTQVSLHVCSKIQHMSRPCGRGWNLLACRTHAHLSLRAGIQVVIWNILTVKKDHGVKVCTPILKSIF